MRGKMLFIPGRWTEEELDRIIRKSANVVETGRRIAALSEWFLGTDYREHTLIGDRDTPEVFVVSLEGVDCFTFIDYVEAMRLSRSFSEFTVNLQKTRYRGGRITFEDRNHFFTDWREFNAVLVEDITTEIGKSATIKVRKLLNMKQDGTTWVPGIPPSEREIRYIPSHAADYQVFAGLRTGDYAGVYSDSAGLDVSHTGIIIRDRGHIYLRHASSRHGKVLDEDLKNYISVKPGLIIFRPRPYGLSL